jgi:hypothetical protein
MYFKSENKFMKSSGQFDLINNKLTEVYELMYGSELGAEPIRLIYGGLN